MKFIYAGKLVELTGERDMNMEQISPSQLRRLVDTGNTSSYFHIQLEPYTTTSLPLTSQTPEINNLLTKYAPLFQPSNTLPPSRPTNHAISNYNNWANYAKEISNQHLVILYIALTYLCKETNKKINAIFLATKQ